MTDITKKQYLITDREISGYDMRMIPLFGNLLLYVGKDLECFICTDRRSRRYILLGNAFCTDTPNKSVKEALADWDKDDPDELIANWTGRYILIAENKLYTDACALLSVFYHTGDRVAISSSLALLSELFDLPHDRSIGGGKMTYQLLPFTICDEVKQLICTQGIELSGEGANLFQRMWFKDRRRMPTSEKCAAAAKILENAAVNISKFSGRKLILALTAGKDSRLALAALIKSGVPFSAYTAEHKGISASDKELPKKIAVSLGFPYAYIKIGELSEEKKADYLNFTLGNSCGADMQFYACGQFDKLPGDSVVIRSGIFEAGQTFGRSIAGNDEGSFVGGMERYYHALRTKGKESEAFAEWLRYVKTVSCDYVDIRDRFYIEQRVCGWVAAIEQSLDMNDFVSLQIANCGELISILLSCNEEERKRLALSFDTLRLLCPSLADYPVNKPSLKESVISFGASVKRKLRKIRKS